MKIPMYYNPRDYREIERMMKTSQANGKYIPKQSMKVKNKKRRKKK